MATLIVRMLAFVLALTAAAGATAQTYTYTFYVGNTNASGCTVQTPAGPVGHVKWRLQTTVTGGATPSVGAFTRSDCSNNVFGAATAVSSTSAVGLNTVPGGLDTFEVQLPVGVVGPTPSPREVLAVVATGSSGSDGLIASVFSKDGLKGTIPGGVTPITIPTAGFFTLALLGIALAALAWRALRRRGHLLMLSLLLIAGSAWAVAIVVDGQIGDWATVTGNSDAAGDSGGQAAIDLRALYVTTQGGNGYLRVDVTDLENPPVADATSASVLEDGNVAIVLTGSDPNNAPLTFQIASPPSIGTLGAITPINASSASVTYTPNADEFGSDAFTFTVSNGTQTSSPATVSITVTPVNDAPSFVAANPPTVNEGAGAQSVPGWASFDAGPANEASQAVLAYQVSNVSNPALFAAGPAVANDGTLTYTLAADASGSASFDVAVQDNGGTANGGADTSATQSFTLTVNAVNDAPVFTGGGNAAALEDAGATLVAGWATGIDDGDPDQAQTLSFQVTDNSNAALFAAGPAVDATTGDLSFTPAADANGSATITLVLTDNGGTANGGVDTSASYNFDIVVTAVNDAPSFTAVDPPAVNEGAGAQSVPNWATFDAGPANESAQNVAEYLVSNVSNPALFAAGPAVANDGTLSYTLAADVSGSASFDVAVRDDGGTANGGVDTSAAQSFTLTVNAVNSAPSFTGGGDVAVAEDAGASTFPGWATAIDDGDPNETQNLTFTVTGNDNPALFAAGPAVDATSGDLTFTPAANANGSAQITLVLSDDGGTANGGADTSPPYVFTITVTAANDAPVVTAPPALPVHAHIAVSVADGSTGDLLTNANVSDVDGPAPYAIATPTATTSANGGQVSIDAATGAFTYNPPAGFTGNDSFTYSVCDAGAPPACSSSVTMTLQVAGRKIWFVDAAAAPGGNGTLQLPLATLAAANAAASSGDAIFLASGTYAGTTLGAGREVVGQAVDGSDFDTALGIAPPSNSIARPAVDGAYARVEGGLTVGSGNTLRGLELDGLSATALQGNAFGTLDVRDDVRIDSDAGAIALVNGSFATGSVFVAVSSAGGVNNVSLDSVGGSVILGSGALAGATGTAFRVEGGSVAASYAGSIAKGGSGQAVAVQNHGGGDLAFSGTLSASGPDTGVRLANNGSGDIVFSGANSSFASNGAAAVSIAANTGTDIAFEGGGLVVNATAAAAFDASGAGTLTVRGSGNRLSSTGGTALRVDGLAIGAAQAAPEAGLRFEKIVSSGGAGSGIVINATGSAGGLNVTGSGGTCADAASCTGGAITGKSGSGIVLTGVAGASFSNLLVDGNAGSGIAGNDLSGFHFLAGRVTDNGDALDGSEANLRFVRLTGSGSIDGSTIRGGSHDQLRFTPDAGTLTGFAITDTDFGPGSANGITVNASGSANVTVSVDGGSFRQLGGSGVASNGVDSSRRDLTVTDSVFEDNFIGVSLLGSGDADLDYDVTASSFLRHAINPIQVASGTTSTNASQWVGNIANVVIGNGTPDSGSQDLHGIAIEMNGDADSIQSIVGNTVNNTDIEGIFVQSRLDNDLDAQIGRHDFALIDNASGTPDDNSAFPFMIVYGNRVEARNTTALCLDMAGNSAGSVGGLEHFRLRQRDTAGFHFERLSDGDGTPGETILSTATVEAHIVGQNDGGSTADATLTTGFTEAADGHCRTP